MPVDFDIIDCHLHTGVQHVNWGWDRIRPLLLASGIRGAAPIAPVEDIYDRYDPGFTDTPAWQACRRRAHQYLLDLKDPEIATYPYFFVWNDFAWEDLGPEYVAIKWHRHPDEPEYHYGDPRCREFLQVVRDRQLAHPPGRVPGKYPVLPGGTGPGPAGDHPPPGGVKRRLRGPGPGRGVAPAAGLCRHRRGGVTGNQGLHPAIRRRSSAVRQRLPLWHPAAELDKILSLDLPEAQTRAILGTTFAASAGWDKLPRSQLDRGIA